MIVFVHGVPETAAIWAKVRAALGRPSVALSLPGFGCPRPDGFGATKDEYADWLAGELERIGAETGEPIDLVSHDWGAGFAYRVVTTREGLVRSWVADVAGIFHPDYVWHDIGKIWQTPGEGEEFFASQEALTPEERAPLFEMFGVSPEDALEIATGADATMGSCILDLYRSAVPNPYADWGPISPATAPGLVLHPTDDLLAGDDTSSREVAAMLGAGFESITGAGHFWPYQEPEQAVGILEKFWAGLA